MCCKNRIIASGRKKEALEYAQEGQLWGPALVLASQLGDQLYGDTVKQMALQQLVAGSPLQTLCLLIAGQPKDVFFDPTASSNMSSSVYTQQPVQVICQYGEYVEEIYISRGEFEDFFEIRPECKADVPKTRFKPRVSMVTTESGLQYKDIKVGQGPSPPVGFQVAANYVAMVPSGQIFDSSLEKGQFYIFRVVSGQVIKGLDEGILSMKIGGKRLLFIPGPLTFPKGLTYAPGRPRVAANSPVVFDVSLEYIPGLEVDDEE